MKKTIGIFAYILLVFGMLTAPVFAATSTSEINQVTVDLVNQDPDPASAGGLVEIRIGAENSGSSTINNLDIEVVPTYPFSIADGEDAKKSAGTLKPYQSDSEMKIVKFKILVDESAKSGTYPLTIRYYENSESVYFEKELDIEVKAEQKAEIVGINTTEIIPGRKTPITFTIKNVGSAPLKDIEFSWENPDNIILPVGSDNTKYIKSLAIGESTELKYEAVADTNADPGLYLLSLTMTYDDDSGDETVISTQAGIYVGGATDFEVAFTDESDGEISFTVANTGSNTAYSVTASIPEQAGYTVTGPSTEIIGNLNSGDYTVVSFEVSKSGNAASDMDVDIIYTDTKGERQTVSKTVSLDTSSSAASGATMSGNFTGTRTAPTGTRGGMGGMSGFSNLTTMAVTAIKYLAVLAVLGLAFLYYRHKKKKQQLKAKK